MLHLFIDGESWKHEARRKENENHTHTHTQGLGTHTSRFALLTRLGFNERNVTKLGGSS